MPGLAAVLAGGDRADDLCLQLAELLTLGRGLPLDLPGIDLYLADPPPQRLPTDRQPETDPTASHVPRNVGYSDRCSCTILTARDFSSSVSFFDITCIFPDRRCGRETRTLHDSDSGASPMLREQARNDLGDSGSDV